MTRDEIIAAVFARPKFGTGPGLARMASIAASLPRTPWLGTGRALHVTGSHGKGTVATLTAALLAANGVRIGLFTSPHLHRFEERIRIRGAEISPEALAAAYGAYDSVEAGARTEENRFGAFEAITGTALHAFARADLDMVVFEAGLGGRLDSTKIAGGTLVALTGIDREHLDLLGPTEIDVLRQKADLCPEGGTLFVGPLVPALRTALASHARAKNLQLRFVEGEVRLSSLRATPSGVIADLSLTDLALPDLETRLFGRAQITNAALALLLAREWLERFGSYRPDPFVRAARETLRATPMPLRFQRLADNPFLYADVAHTPASTRALAETIRLHLGNDKIILVLGCAAEKDAVEIARPLAPLALHIHCTEAGHRALPARDLADRLSRQGWEAQISSAPLAEALTQARAQSRPVIVTGSLFLARDTENLLSGRGAPDPSL